MADYALKEPFDIDNGELDGLSPQDCFVMGAEWLSISSLLETGESIQRPIHSENISRIKRMCIRRGRSFKISPTGTEGWHELVVES